MFPWLPTVYQTSAGLEYLIKALCQLYPAICELIEMPNKTLGGRSVFAIRIGKKPAADVDTLLFTGNVHARELGTGDFCAYFAYNICVAYQAHTDLTCGDKTFSYRQIKSIIEDLNLLIVPCVNPDGRDYSLQGALAGNARQALWRGNRNWSHHPGDHHTCTGVDLNRNQDFLWDHFLHFAPSASVSTNAQPCEDPGQNFRGISATSERETRNLVWLMDQFPYIYAYIDFHCAYGAIVHPWGDDQLQLSNPSMNFMNPVYDHQRDPNSGSYGEYMPPEDLETFRRLGQKFCNALAGVRGTTYQVMSAVELAPAPDVDPQSPALWWYFATSGANDDYAYSRHFSDPSKSKILAFTVEFGTPVDNTSDATAMVGFQPAIPQMQWIIQDLIAGTLGFCLEVRASVPSQRLRLLIALLVAVITLLVVSLCTAL